MDTSDDDTGQHGDARACQVKGCTSNLKTESLKHQRLRICAEHEKAMTVHVNGAASRFCQQCTKFHAIDNFDGNNRGCRKRLQKHNERRKQKTVVKKLGKELQKVVGSLLCAKAQLNGIQDVGEASGSGSCPPGRGGGLQTFLQTQVHNMKTSPELAGLAASGSNLCGANASNGTHYAGSWQRGGNHSFTPLGSAALGKPPHGSSATNCPWGSNKADEVNSSEQAGRRKASPLSALRRSNDGSNELDEGQPGNLQAQDGYNAPAGYHSGGSEESHCHREVACDKPGMQTSPALDNMGWRAPYDLSHASHDEVLQMAWNDGWHPSELMGPGYNAGNNGRWCPPEQAYHGPGTGCSNHFASSMKITGITPGALPDDLRQEIVSWLQIEPHEMNGSIRPGCVHLALDMWFHTAAERALAQESMPKGFARSVTSQRDLPWCSHKTFLRLPDRLLTADCGRIVSEDEVAPHKQPVAIAPLTNVAKPGSWVKLLVPLGDSGTVPLCRSNGQYVHLGDHRSEPAAEGQVLLSARLPADLPCGLAWVELCDASGGSHSVPILVTDVPNVAEELQHTSPGETAVLPPALLKHVARVLHEPWAAKSRAALLNSCATVAVMSAMCSWATLHRACLSKSLPLVASGDPAAALLRRMRSDESEQALFEARTALFKESLRHGASKLPLSIVTLLANQETPCAKCAVPSIAAAPLGLAFQQHPSSSCAHKGSAADAHTVCGSETEPSPSPSRQPLPQQAAAATAPPSWSWCRGRLGRVTLALGAAFMAKNLYSVAIFMAMAALAMGFSRLNLLQNAGFTLYWGPVSQQGGFALPLSHLLPAAMSDQARAPWPVALPALPKAASHWTPIILTFGLVAPLDLAYCQTAAVYAAHIPVDVMWAFATILLWQSGCRAWQVTSFLLGNALGMVKLYLSTVALHPTTFADVELMHSSGISILIPALLFHVGRGVLQSACLQVAPLRTMLVLRAAMWLLTMTHSWLTEGYFLHEPSKPDFLRVFLYFVSTFVADLSTMSFVLVLRERLVYGSKYGGGSKAHAPQKCK